MAKRTNHKDVEYSVDTADGEKIFKNYDEAAVFALSRAMSGSEVTLDVLVYSAAGARHVRGEEGVEWYKEDPEASVFDRYEISVNNVGRVP